MFCPNCGTQNPETGRFCRTCGADLGNVSAALSGKLPKQQNLVDRKGKPISYESAIVKIFTGLAFLAVAIILGITKMAGGQGWWFWMLIPAFGSLGSGIAQLVQMRSNEKNNATFTAQNSPNVFSAAPPNAVLPPPSANLDEIKNLVDSNRKIEAIKVYRETYGSGLKEAKEAVERMAENHTAPNKYGAPPPRGSVYDTGELTAPPSVTENTTRHLEIDNEGETMTLPKSNL